MSFFAKHSKIIGIYIISIFAILFYAFPIYWMIATSLTPESILYQYPPKIIPETFTLQNFYNIWSTTNFAQWFVNSAKIAASVCITVVIVATFAGYSLTRFKYRTERGVRINWGLTFARFALFAYMFPRIIFAIPNFIIMKNLQRESGSFFINTLSSHQVCSIRFHA